MAYSKAFLLLSLILVFTLLISSEVHAARQLTDHTGEESFQMGNPKVRPGGQVRPGGDHAKGKNCGKPNSVCHGGHHPGHGGNHPKTNTETNGK